MAPAQVDFAAASTPLSLPPFQPRGSAPKSMIEFAIAEHDNDYFCLTQ
jgi:hypothetical protein